MEPLTFGYNEAWENRKCYWIYMWNFDDTLFALSY